MNGVTGGWKKIQNAGIKNSGVKYKDGGIGPLYPLW